MQVRQRRCHLFTIASPLNRGSNSALSFYGRTKCLSVSVVQSIAYVRFALLVIQRLAESAGEARGCAVDGTVEQHLEGKPLRIRAGGERGVLEADLAECGPVRWKEHYPHRINGHSYGQSAHCKKAVVRVFVR